MSQQQGSNGSGDDGDTAAGRRSVAVALAVVAGFVDAAGFVALDLFSAHMSGNSARLGVYLGGGLLHKAAPSIFAVVVFVVAIGAGTLAVELLARSGRRSPTAVVLAAELALLVVLAVIGGSEAVNGRIPHGPAGVFYPLAALAVGAMGLQTSTLQRISGRIVRTTYVSGMLTNLAEEVVAVLVGPAAKDGGSGGSYIEGELGVQPGAASVRRIGLIVGIWLAYAGGAVLGAYLERRIHFAAFALPAALLAVVLVAELRRPVALSSVKSG